MPGSAKELQTNHAVLGHRDAADGAISAIQGYLKCGYSQISHGALDYWMPKLSGPEFKLLMLFSG